MDPFAQKKPVKNQHQPAASNNFARALAEKEHSLNTPKPQNPGNPFSEALARTGGRLDDGSSLSNSDQNRDQLSQDELQRQQEEMERQQKKEALKKKRHAEINPVDMKDVYDAKKRKEKEDVRKIREELKALSKDIEKFEKEVAVATFQDIIDPGMEGTYHRNFLHQLRMFIMLLRKKVQSARTWMQQANAKKAKKKKKGGKKPGMEMGGSKHEQGKTVFDTMHHERASSYGGS
jgi:LPS O-antigen subunit length determinant protein (WzzB/FepE family)